MVQNIVIGGGCRALQQVILRHFAGTPLGQSEKDEETYQRCDASTSWNLDRARWRRTDSYVGWLGRYLDSTGVDQLGAADQLAKQVQHRLQRRGEAC